MDELKYQISIAMTAIKLVINKTLTLHPLSLSAIFHTSCRSNFYRRLFKLKTESLVNVERFKSITDNIYKNSVLYIDLHVTWLNLTFSLNFAAISIGLNNFVLDVFPLRPMCNMF